MELNAAANRFFMALSLAFVVLVALSTHKPGQGMPSKNKHHKKTDVTINNLPMDTAIVEVTCKPTDKNYSLFGISDNCHKCPPQKLLEGINGGTKVNITVETSYPFTLVLRNFWGKDHPNCTKRSYSFKEHGFYRFGIHFFKHAACDLTEVVKPDNAYLPLLYAFLCITGVAILFTLGLHFLRKYDFFVTWKTFQDTESLLNADLGTPNFSGSVDDRAQSSDMMPKIKKRRLKSLDTFRGIALTIMIFVNNGGGGYYFFKHARWDGLTVADLVFPWFMWIMGLSVAISFRSLRQRQVIPIKIFLKIVRRTIILFGLGLLVSNYADLANYRVPGVLQRFAACYFILSMLLLVTNPGTDSVLPVGAWWNPLRDVVVLWGQWLFMLCLLTIYIVATFALKMPDCPRGYIGPGGLAANDSTYNCTGGTAGYIDRHLFGFKHIYQKPTCMKTYKTKFPYDPEGALGTLTSSFLVFLGVQAGYTLFTFPNHISRMKRWVIWSVLLGCITLALTGKNNEGAIPLNKNLWSVSFIFATGGMAFMLLTFCYLLVDVLGWWSGAPFVFPGMNSILVYVGSEILSKYFPFSWKVNGHVQHGELLAMNITGTTVWILISYYLYYIKFFVKI
ncbi:heparan-alpha-glucosaminide N-acetyltransferase-like [Acropora millepora]|uniref:heparan-alpha-glucosaminide N-acetyltransferase-like n=1 Tax=Acropora millepora TaxID=45264 RepID=UPI001CF25F0A|nr:heparan-alpha-glucosaminide N-acetyltransferase-like [Acropora millepora]